jgi:signal transduction histidine kinase
VAARLQASKNLMDQLRTQVTAITNRETAVTDRQRSTINSLESAEEAVDIAGLVLGAVGGLVGIALFGTGIARRLRAAVGNAGRLGRGEPVEVAPAAHDELGQLSDATVQAAELLERRSVELAGAVDAAMQASQAKTEFLSRVSHELRTPLNAMLGFTQLLELDESDPDRRRDIARILRAGEHLLVLINDVLDIARIESREMTLSVEPVGLSDVLATAADMLQPLASSRHIVIDQAGVETGLVALADRQRLKQVLLNLLSNAVKYNRDAGTVSLSCRCGDDQWVQVAVSDTGPGLTDTQLERIFLPFERVGNIEVEGTGIGLTLTKGLVEAMGGQLSVESKPGVGSTFTVRLLSARPSTVDDEPPASIPNRPSPALEAGSEADTRVLYIEDNVANVQVLEQLLKNRPRTTLYAASTGQLGLDLARHHHPTLILLDLHLPDMTGDHVLTRLRAEPGTATTPITILSADATAGTVRRLLAKGATNYLTKPVKLRELLALLDAVQ